MLDQHPTSPRLKLLEQSLTKKKQLFNDSLQQHFETVRAANGQPLNDKRNGQTILTKWGRQNERLRSLTESIQKTEAAIEREKYKLARVAKEQLPTFIKVFLDTGELIQWRKYPNRFFVAGVDKGRFVWDSKNNSLKVMYLSKVPEEQRERFREIGNRLIAAYNAYKSATDAS